MTREYTGYWTFDKDSEYSFSGTIVISKKNISLNILGRQDSLSNSFNVYGILKDGATVTLFNCYTIGTTMSIPGIPTMTIDVSYMFIGKEKFLLDLSFDSARFLFPTINHWLNIKGFDFYRNKGRSISLEYSTPNPIDLLTNESIKITLDFITKAPLGWPALNCSIEQTTFICIEQNNSFSLDEFWKYLSIIRSFFTLAFFSDPEVIEIKLTQKNKSYELYYAGQNSSEYEIRSHRTNFLFTYNLIQEDLKVIFEKWYTLYDIIEPVINIVQESFRNRNVVLESRFLNLMQGVETFHRRLRKNEVISKESHKKRVAEILDAVDNDYKVWLKEKLNFSNELTLGERLEELFSEIDSDIVTHIFENPSEIISKSKHTRNYFTHYSPSLKRKAVFGDELHELSERIKILLLILLLKEIGLNDTQVRNIITVSSYYLFNYLIKESGQPPTASAQQGGL